MSQINKFEKYELKTLLKYADSDAFINLLLVTADSIKKVNLNNGDALHQKEPAIWTRPTCS